MLPRAAPTLASCNLFISFSPDPVRGSLLGDLSPFPSPGLAGWRCAFPPRRRDVMPLRAARGRYRRNSGPAPPLRSQPSLRARQAALPPLSGRRRPGPGGHHAAAAGPAAAAAAASRSARPRARLAARRAAGEVRAWGRVAGAGGGAREEVVGGCRGGCGSGCGGVRGCKWGCGVQRGL